MTRRWALPLALFFASAPLACGDEEDDRPTDAGVVVDAGDEPDGGDSADGGAGDGATSDASTDAGITGPRSMIFLHTNDEHSHVLGFGPEIDDYPTPADPSNTSIVGGVKRRAKLIQQLKTEALIARTPIAVVSAGDMMMGSLFHLGNTNGLDYAIATVLQYDAVTLGNHEFDFGVNVLRDALSRGGISSQGAPGIVRFPVVTSNIRFSIDSDADDRLAALYSAEGMPGRPLRRFHVQTFGNVKVGFIGLMGLEAALVAPFKAPVRFSLATDETACTSNTQCPSRLCLTPASDAAGSSGRCVVDARENLVATHFPALIADAASAVRELRARGVDLVVALSHVGVDDRELNTLRAMGRPAAEAVRSEEIVLALGVDRALTADGVPGIDLVIGGHSHSTLETPLQIPNPRSGRTTYIVQAGEYGKYLGKLRLDQAEPGRPWTLNEDYTELVKIDASISPTGIAPTTELIIDLGLRGVIETLEGNALATANDDAIFPGEQCDGAALPNDGDCAPIIPGATGGTLACLPNRQLDTTGCTFPTGTCSDGVLDAPEACDGANLGGATCASLGYDSGALACRANCTFDLSACVPHFPSLLEAALAFGRVGYPSRNDPATPGDLVFAPIGTTTFDVPAPSPHAESNLMNLVTDAERAILNRFDPDSAADPVRVVLNANGVLRDGIQGGRTGVLTFSDLFRVLPLGLSPIEATPGFPLVDFHLTAAELKQALEIGVNQGLVANSFWLGVSGARVEYDPTRPDLQRITKIVLTSTAASVAPWDDAVLEDQPLYDLARGEDLAGFPDPTRPIHIATNLYNAVFAEALGLCPRRSAADGFAPLEECRPCTQDAECTRPNTTCDEAAGRCVGGNPAAYRVRSLAPVSGTGLFQEIKEFLALLHYIRELPGPGALPPAYAEPVPRRMCCVGTACTAEQSCP